MKIYLTCFIFEKFDKIARIRILNRTVIQNDGSDPGDQVIAVRIRPEPEN